jgi:hypothetical protein
MRRQDPEERIAETPRLERRHNEHLLIALEG